MRGNRKFFVLAAIVLLLFGGGTDRMLIGQSTFGSIIGNVTDPNGAVIPGAQVALTHEQTSVSREAAANEAGIYEFLNLVPGTYRIQVRVDGFKSFVQEGIALGSLQTIRVDCPMELGSVSETVTVMESVGLIETENSNVSGTVHGGEEFFLSPNSTSQRPWALMRLDPLVQNTFSSTRFSMGGAYFSQSEFQIDGISAPLGSGRVASSMVMSSEAVEEVKIMAVNNKAEYTSPGVFTEISKGGTNQFHGDVFYRFAHSAMNARVATSKTKPESKTHWFGGNIGGPVFLPGYNGRNKTFFSASWQSTRNPGERVYSANVPTQAMRRGIFSAEISDPFTGDLFPNNTIPADRINSSSRYFQDTFYPAPNTGAEDSVSNNHQVSGPNGTTREENVDFRLDQNINAKHWMFVRAGGTQFNNRGYDSNLPTVGFRARTRKLYTTGLSYTYSVRPNLLHELRAGFIRDNRPNGGSNSGREILNAAGIIFPSDLPAPDTRGFPVIDITGAQKLSQTNTQSTISQSYQLSDNISWITGKHTIKTGVNIFWEQPNISRVPTGAHGEFRFRGRYTGQAYADFLLGIPDRTRVAGIDPNRYMRSTNYGLFLQDDFKVNSHLTLNLGLRWDYQGGIYNKNNSFYNFDPATGGLIKASPDTPVNPAFVEKYPKIPILDASEVGLRERTLHFADKNNFAPRIGFAWRPRGSSSFVVRGGWGKFTDILGQGLYEQFASGGFLSRGRLSLNNKSLSNGVLPDSAFLFPFPFPSEDVREAPGSLRAQGFNPHLANPYVQQWNFTLEKQWFDTAFRVSYLGTKSTNLIYKRDINQRLTAGKDSSRPLAGVGWGRVEYMDNGGSQIYHGLQFRVERRLQDGFMFRTGYTWNNNISDVIDGGDRDYTNVISNAFDRSLERGRVGFTRTHNFVAAMVWELPFGRGRHFGGNASGFANGLISGWQLYPQFYAGSGQWVSPRRKGSNPFTGASGETARADRIGDGNDGPSLTGSSTLKWFNIDAFAQPDSDHLGNAGRNIIEGPGFWSTHLALTKKIRFGERKEFWVTMAAQNLFNHPNWRHPSTSGELTFGNAAFGSTSRLISSDRGARGNSRNLMLRLRFLF